MYHNYQLPAAPEPAEGAQNTVCFLLISQRFCGWLKNDNCKSQRLLEPMEHHQAIYFSSYLLRIGIDDISCLPKNRTQLPGIADFLQKICLIYLWCIWLQCFSWTLDAPSSAHCLEVQISGKIVGKCKVFYFKIDCLGCCNSGPS